MNNSELFEKAIKAGFDYRKMYGKFPEKIGIHYKRLAGFPSQIVFPELPPVQMVVIEEAPDAIMISQHVCPFEPVAGDDIRWNEVYLPVFLNGAVKAVGSEDMARITQPPAPLQGNAVQSPNEKVPYGGQQ